MDKIKGWELKFPTFLYILFAACPVGQAAEQRFREVQSSSFIQNTHANSLRGLRAANSLHGLRATLFEKNR